LNEPEIEQENVEEALEEVEQETNREEKPVDLSHLKKIYKDAQFMNEDGPTSRYTNQANDKSIEEHNAIYHPPPISTNLHYNTINEEIEDDVKTLDDGGSASLEDEDGRAQKAADAINRGYEETDDESNEELVDEREDEEDAIQVLHPIDEGEWRHYSIQTEFNIQII